MSSECRPDLSNLKRAEEARRESRWDPQKRWQIVQATIAWAESQATARRNVRAARLREQAEKLARLQTTALTTCVAGRGVTRLGSPPLGVHSA